MDDESKRLMRKIIDALAAIQGEIQAANEQRKAEDGGDQVPTRLDVRSELRVPVSITEYYEAENKKKKSKWRWVKIFLEVAGITSWPLPCSRT